MAPARSPEDPWNAFTRDPSEETFRPVYEATQRLVWTICVRILRNPADAGDAFQAAYGRLVALARDPGPSHTSCPGGSVAGAAEPGGGWLVETACRFARLEADSLRKRRARRGRRERPLGELEPMERHMESAEAALARREVRERIEALVAELPDALRLPVEFHYLHGLSQRDVARAMGQPLSTVSDRLRAALRRLDASFRRAGLREAAATLAGIALGGGLLKPPLAAAEVFARAQVLAAAAATAATASGAGTSTITLPGLAALTIAIMKTKTIVVLAVAAVAVSSALLLATREPPAPRDPVARDGGPGARVVEAPGRPPAAPEPEPAVAGAGSQVAVAVLWEGSDEPVLDAGVSVVAGEGQAPLATARTGAEGRAALAVPRTEGTATIAVHHVEAVAQELAVSLPLVEPVTVRLARDVIAGTVTDALSGKPLAGAVVSAGVEKAEAAEDGSYSLRRLGKRVHGLKASADGYADRSAQVNHSPPARSLQDFALDPAAAVEITVVDEAGESVPGAAISAEIDGIPNIFRPRGLATDEQGFARLEKESRIAPPQIQASKEGYQTATGRPSSSPDADRLELRLVLGPSVEERRAIIGRVADATGRPIAGAVIEWKDAFTTRFGDGVEYGQFRAVTDRAGAYRLEFTDAHDLCHLGVAAKGWGPVVAQNVRSGSLAAPAERNFTLEPGHWLKGRVVDEDGRPLAGVRVEVMPSLHLLSEGVAYPAVYRQVKTDAEGRFALEDLAGPKAGIRLHASRFVPGIRDGGRPELKQEVEVDQEVEFVLKGHGAIRGRVTDAASGAPVTAFRIRILGSVSNERVLPGETFTSADGLFVLRQLERDSRYGVIVEADGYVRETVRDLEPGDEESAPEVHVALKKGRAVEGLVVDAATGAALAGVEVLAGDPERVRETVEKGQSNAWLFVVLDLTSLATDGAGRFSLREGEPGALLFRAPGRQRLLVEPARRAELTGPDGILRVPLAGGERLRGVYRENGKPVAGVEVRLERVESDAAAGKPLPALASTDAEGAFGWDDLLPGPQVVEFTRRVPDANARAEVKLLYPVELEAGEENRLDFGDDGGTVTLRGRLAGMEGRESVWATLVLRPLAAEQPAAAAPEVSVTTYKDWGWRFTCPYLRPGKYEVQVSYYEARATRTVELPPITVTGDEEREIEVPGGG